MAREASSIWPSQPWTCWIHNLLQMVKLAGAFCNIKNNINVLIWSLKFCDKQIIILLQCIPHRHKPQFWVYKLRKSMLITRVLLTMCTVWSCRMPQIWSSKFWNNNIVAMYQFVKYLRWYLHIKDCLCKVFSPNEINVHSHIFVPKDQAVFSKDYVRARDELNTGVWEC